MSIHCKCLDFNHFMKNILTCNYNTFLLINYDINNKNFIKIINN